MRRDRRPDLNLRIVTWYQFDLAVAHIAAHLRGVTYSGVYGEPRGGLSLALALSHRMELPMLSQPDPHGIVLWVDDIVDSGKALRAARRRHWTIESASMFLREGASVVPDVHAFTAYEGEWIVFPWECPEHASREAAEYASR